MQVEYAPPKLIPKVPEAIEQRATISIGNVVDFFQSHNLDIRLVGSVGRELSLLSKLPDMQTPHNPFRLYKDFDLLVIGQEKDRMCSLTLLKKANEIAYPFPVEISKYVESDGRRTLIRYRKLKYEVSPKVFERYEVNLDGRKIPTLNPNTLFHLTAIYLELRSKDFKDLISYGRAILFKDNILPEQLFENFHRLMKEKYKFYPLDICVAGLRSFYLKHNPTLLRKHVDPFLEKAIQSYSSRI